jgi:hypothetical protein
MANERIDFSKYLAGMRAERGGRAESEGVSWHAHPQRETRSQSEKEQFPDYFQRQQKQKEQESEYRRGRGY